MNKSQAVLPAKAGIQENNLPKDWQLVPLSKLRGGTAKSINPADQPDRIFELYSVPSFLDGVPEVISGKEIGSSKRVVEPNTVLLSKINPRINRAWIVGAAGKHKQISSPEWVEFFPTNDVEPKYLMYFMQNYKFREHLSMNVSGVGGSLTRIRPKVVEDYEIPLAPKEQQKRIVAKIEELFSHIDAGIEALKKAKSLLKQYRQSVLKAAVTGELTKEWREANKDKLEPASQLLERILKERRQKWEEQQLEQFKTKGKMPKDDKWKEKYKELAPVLSEELERLPDLPDSWTYTRLGNVINEPKYGTSKKCTYDTNGVGVLRIPNVANGVIDSDDLKYAQFDESDIETYRLNEGDILTIRSNGSINLVGKCALIRENDINYLYAGYLVRLHPNSVVVDGPYLINALNSIQLRQQIESKAKSTSGVNNINSGELQALIIPVCNKDEQAVVAALVDEKLEATNRLLSEIELHLAKTDKNKQSILASAYSGVFSHG